MSQAVILRADGSGRFGMGHIFRCVALAQGLQAKGHTPVFVVKDHAPNVIDLIRQRGFQVISQEPQGFGEDARSVVKAARSRGAKTVIVDLNHPETLADEAGFADYLAQIKDSGCWVMMIDGLGQECISTRRVLAVDVLLIPYVGAGQGKYEISGGTNLLLGPDYYPFQKDFLQMAGKAKHIAPKGRRILVSMGGGDVAKLNEKVVRAIRSLGIPDIELKVTGIPLSGNMPELIHWADLAVISSGLTKYETSLLGTPAIVLSFNKKQKSIMDIFEQAGSVRHLGGIDELTESQIAQAVRELAGDEPLRKQMCLNGKKIVDGHGLERTIDQIPLEVSL